MYTTCRSRQTRLGEDSGITITMTDCAWSPLPVQAQGRWVLVTPNWPKVCWRLAKGSTRVVEHKRNLVAAYAITGRVQKSFQTS
eukprot:2926118-Pleurochrysis_carterae.AAC.1